MKTTINICDICNKSVAETTCVGCGKDVCHSHSDTLRLHLESGRTQKGARFATIHLCMDCFTIWNTVTNIYGTIKGNLTPDEAGWLFKVLLAANKEFIRGHDSITCKILAARDKGKPMDYVLASEQERTYDGFITFVYIRDCVDSEQYRRWLEAKLNDHDKCEGAELRRVYGTTGDNHYVGTCSGSRIFKKLLGYSLYLFEQGWG